MDPSAGANALTNAAQGDSLDSTGTAVRNGTTVPTGTAVPICPHAQQLLQSAYAQRLWIYHRRIKAIHQHTISQVAMDLMEGRDMTPERAKIVLKFFKIFHADMKGKLPAPLDMIFEAVDKSESGFEHKMKEVYRHACDIVLGPSRYLPNEPVESMQRERIKLLKRALKFLLCIQADKVIADAEMSIVGDFFFNFFPPTTRIRFEIFPAHPPLLEIGTWSMRKAVDATVNGFWWRPLVEQLLVYKLFNHASPEQLAETKKAVEKANKHVLNATMLHLIEEEGFLHLITRQTRRVMYCPSCQMVAFRSGWDIVEHLFIDPFWSAFHQIFVKFDAHELALFKAVIDRIQTEPSPPSITAPTSSQ